MSKVFFKSICQFVIVGILMFCSRNSVAQDSPLLKWAGHFKGAAGVSDNFGYGIVTDATGNVYSTGSYSGTTDFDPGLGVFNLISAFGSQDIYVSKLDNNGNFVWAKSIGQGVLDAGYSIAVDAGGNVYITGTYRGNVDFDPGPGIFTLAGSALNFSFILKLDTDGNFLWAKPISAGSTVGSGRGIAIDNSNNVLVTGIYSGTVDFDPGAGIFNMTSAGGDEIYVIKLDANGNFVWAKSMGGTGFDRGFSIAIDNSDNVLTTGSYSGVGDFDPGAGLFSMTGVGITDIFISKLDASGNFVWAKSMGGLEGDVGNSLTTDGLNNVIITGRFKSTVDFDPGAAVFNLSTGSSNEDGFIAKLDASGNFGWAVSIGGSTLQGDSGNGITTDVSGNVLVTGYFEGTVDFNFGAGTFNLTSAIFGTDIFLLKLDTNGNSIWAVQTGGNNNQPDEGNAITVDAFGHIWSTGSYSTAADFDFGPCSFSLNAEFNVDINTYVEKISAGNFGPPTITSFTPTAGTVATTVTITGTNFSTTPSENVVRFFNNRTATVTASTATSITAVVPASTITGVITVTTNCLTATSATNFTIGAAPPPTITSFTPASGPIGTTVTIIGTNFNTIPANNIVYFGATQAIVSAATATQLTVTVPVGATYQPVTVNVAGLIAYSAKPFTVTFSGGGIIDPCSFAAKIDFTTGLDPSSVSISDLDGDGNADLAVSNANPGGNTISVLRNTGSGPGNISYAAKVDFITGPGSQPWSVSAGDLNGDGNADLAVANSAGNFVSVFRNTSSGVGNINFATKLDFATGVRPQSVSIADFDGDGKPDLALANLNSNTISVFRNTSSLGSISFAAKVDFATGTAPRSVSIADLDGDGKPDLAVVNSSTASNSVSIIRNTSSIGSISFATKVDFATGTQPYSVSIGDLDGDNKPDLAVTNSNSNTVSLFRNTSSIGVVNYAVKVDFTTGIFPISVSIGDLDGNGKVDLAVANFSSNTLSIFRNTSSIGSFSFANKVDFTSGSGPYLVSIGDLDGDGKVDLVSPNVIGDNVSVFRNTIGSISPPTITSFTPTSGSIGASITITGTNFDIIPANNIVSFNGIATPVTGSTSTTLNTTMPVGATTGKITVTIGCNTATSATDFVVTMTTLPTITSFTPPSGPVGTTVTITGTNFSTTPANNTVAFNGTTSVVTASTITSITATVPAGATTGAITVTVAGNTATSATNFTVTSVAQTWVRQMGGTSQQRGEAITIDGSGNSYTTGYFTGIIDFDPGSAVFNLTALSSDVFVVKLNSNGDFIWVKSWGGTSGDEGTSVQVDAVGNVYVAGSFSGTVDFNPSAAVFSLTSAGSRDVFISKLDNAGNFIWAKKVGGTSIDDCGAIALDATGNIYATGYFNGTSDFDPGAPVVGLTSAGSADIFLLKLDNNGNFVWAQQIGAAGSDSGNSITVSALGNVFITGDFNNTVDFDPGVGTINLASVGDRDIFISKFNSSGNLTWAKSIGSDSFDHGYSLITDAAENVYTTGDFSNQADFDPGVGTFNLLPDFGAAAFVVKLTNNGNFVWATQFAGPDGSTSAFSIGIDGSAKTYVIGEAFDGVDDSDIIMAGFDSNGNQLFQDRASSGSGQGRSLAVNGSGTIYATGYFDGTMNFNLGDCLGSFSGVNDDIFILKTISNSPTITSFSPTSGTIGTTVIITGTNFSSTPGNNQVDFNGASATVTASTPTSITTTVPAGASSGKFYVSTGCSSATSTTDFIVDCGPIPTITSFSPTSGVAGTTVVITGTNFSTTPIDNIVDFDGYPSVVSASTSTTITTTVPTGPIGLVPVSVKIACNSITSPTNFDVTCPPAPTITSFTPGTGAVGAAVTITGTNFSTNPLDNFVDFNGEPAIVTASTATSITTSVPTNAFTGPINVYVGCDVASSSTDFIVDCGPAPTIISFSPSNGLAGTVITITGANFSTTPANNFVDFNGELAVITASTATSITTTVPVGAVTGPITIVVDCNFVTSTTDFTVGNIIAITTQPSDFIACVGQTATFTTAASGTTNIVYQWQFSPDGIIPFTDIVNGGGYSNATTATLSVNTTGNFGLGRYRCRINGDFATEVITTNQGLSINPVSTAPTVVGANRCGAGSVTLTASGGINGQYKWYTTATGGTAIAGETNGSYVTPSITSTTSYYVSLNTNGCESTRTLVTAAIAITPAPTATGVSGCPASAVTLTASGGTNGQYNWYTVSTGGTAIAGATNNTYQISSLTVTSTFYVSLTVSGCESTRTPVTATLLSTGCAPVITTQTLTTQVEGKIEINLQSLITTPGTLDPTSIKVITQPVSGAVASITNFLLVIDYKGKPFSGKETIIIEACNTNGLCAQQTFTIEVAGEIIVFNAVSPNGDGKNEFLVLQFIESISPNNQVSIFNRWGDEVFSISDYDNKTRVFAGLTTSGNKIPSGTYFYKIALPNVGKTLTGFIDLRN